MNSVRCEKSELPFLNLKAFWVSVDCFSNAVIGWLHKFGAEGVNVIR